MNFKTLVLFTVISTPILKDNPYLFYPNFDVGVIDVRIYSNYEDLHKFIQKVPSNSISPIKKV